MLARTALAVIHDATGAAVPRVAAGRSSPPRDAVRKVTTDSARPQARSRARRAAATPRPEVVTTSSRTARSSRTHHRRGTACPGAPCHHHGDPARSRHEPHPPPARPPARPGPDRQPLGRRRRRLPALALDSRPGHRRGRRHRPGHHCRPHRQTHHDHLRHGRRHHPPVHHDHPLPRADHPTTESPTCGYRYLRLRLSPAPATPSAPHALDGHLTALGQTGSFP
jgi:hypothetical protein